MPKWLHDKLARKAREKFPGDEERQKAYTYKTLRKIEARMRRKR